MPNLPDDLSTELRDIKRQLRQLATLAMGKRAFTEITSGQVKISADAGLYVMSEDEVTALAYFGMLGPEYDRTDGTPQVGLLFRRESGSKGFAVSDPDPDAGTGAQIVAIYDQGETEVVSDDQSGQGIARPYIPVPFVRADPTGTTGWPLTTSATYADLLIGTTYKQQPRVIVQGMVYCSTSATAADIRLTANGSQIGSTQAIAAGTYGYWTVGPVSTPGAHLSSLDLRVQVRRTAGTGNVHAIVTTASQYQS